MVSSFSSENNNFIGHSGYRYRTPYRRRRWLRPGIVEIDFTQTPRTQEFNDLEAELPPYYATMIEKLVRYGAIHDDRIRLALLRAYITSYRHWCLAVPLMTEVLALEDLKIASTLLLRISPAGC